MDGEGNVETRVFSLWSPERERSIVGLCGFWTVSYGLMLWMDCQCNRSAMELALRAAFIPFTLALSALLYWEVRSRKLVVSDAGLRATQRLTRSVIIGWDDVQSVDTGAPLLFKRFKGPRRTVIKGAQKRSILIPGTCPDSAEIISILRQRLPAEVFQER